MPRLLPLALLGNLGGPDLLIIGLVAVLILGKRIPQFARNLHRLLADLLLEHLFTLLCR